MVLQQGYKNIGGYKMEDMTSKGFDPDVEDIDNSDVNEYNEREILVAKRKGTYETFKVGKLADSIFAAAAEVGGEDLQIADDLATEIQDMLESNDIHIIEASDLHDMVYKCLVDNKHAATSERYLTESIKRSNQREMDTALMKSFEEITFKSEEDSEVKRENANIDSSTAMGTMLKYGSEAAKNFNLLYLMTPDVANAHRNGDIHIHDLDFLSLTETCAQIPLDKLFDGGFNTGHGYLRQPGSIRAAAAQAAIAIQSNQNDQHGGQSIPLFDYYLAPYVALTYVKQIAHIAKIKFDLNKEKYHELKHRLVDYQKEHKNVMNEQGYNDINDILVQFCEEFKIKASKNRLKKVMKDAYDDTYYDTYQAMEAFIHNLNTMHCLPASEKIWVLDVKTNNLTLMTMEALDSVFEPKRFKVISLNKKTGKAEFKFITKSQRKDNQRKLVKLKDNQGRAVRVTDNHKLMTMDGIKISEKLPKDCEYTLSPRGIDFPPVKYDMCVSDFGKPRKDNAFQNDHVIVSEAFAEFMGYYMGDGCILGQTSTCCISACGKVTFEYMEDLLKRAFGCEFRTSYTYFNHSKEGKTEKDIRIQLGMPLARMIASKFGRIGKEKHIPVEILMGPREVRIAFLKAYFAMDGRKDAKYSELSTCTEVLQKQVALMLSSLGVSPHYGETIIDGNRKVFFVSLSAHDSYECGLKDSDETAFQIPKYDLSMVYDAYKKECDDITGRRTSHKLRYSELEELIDEHDAKDVMHLRNVFINNIESTEDESSGDEYVYDISVEDNETFLTEDCIFVHNSRAGAQVPFSSINYGTDTSTEGRMVMETILKSTWDGLGNGEIPIFPIQIFKLKAGVSYNKEDPNYDLFELSCKVSAKRLYPNFVNLDAPYNAELYVPGHPETEMATMGCVESSEILHYTIDGLEYIETFEKAYNRISNLRRSTEYSYNSDYIDVSDIDVRVKDSVHGFVKVKKFIKNKNVNNFNVIKFSDGYSLTATSDHPLPVVGKGRTFVKDLNIGDKVEVSRNDAVNSDDKFMTAYFKEYTYLLGVILADASYKTQICISLGLDEKDVVDYIKSIVNDLGYRLNVKEQHRDTKGDYFDCCIRGIKELRYAESELASIFGGYKKAERSIPSSLLTASRKYRLAFLAGLMDADGHVTCSDSRDGETERSARFSIGSTNKALAMTELALIRGLGYKAKMDRNKYSSKHSKIRYIIEFEITDELVAEMHCGKKINKANTVDRCKFSDVDAVEVVSITSGCEENELNGISYDLETESDMLDISYISSHNCRTRVSTNKHDLGKQVIPGRGNLSFTSINLPRLAIMSNGDIDKFYKLLDNRLELVHKQLLQRFELQCLKHPINYPFLMGQGVWIGSDLLGPNDDIRDILKNGTLGVGFIGLAETLTSLIGEHHGQSERAEKLGLEIIQHMRDYTDAWSENEHMNYGVIGTPAEGLSGRFVRMDKKKFGVIPGVTDKEYYTNSSHIPVSFPISATKKIQLEAPFHAIENGGHILYIEMDGDPTKNVGAFMKVVRYMHDNNAGYFAINHPVDRDPVCNYTGIIDDVCPRCGRKEGEPMTMEMWKRIHQTAGAGNICTCGACGDPNEEADRISNAIDTSDLKFDYE